MKAFSFLSFQENLYMLEYLSPPLLYRTHLDSTIKDCYYSTTGALSLPDKDVISLHLHKGKVYYQEICLVVLKEGSIIMLQALQPYIPVNTFYILASDRREWLVSIDNVYNATVVDTPPDDGRVNDVDYYLMEYDQREEATIL